MDSYADMFAVPFFLTFLLICYCTLHQTFSDSNFRVRIPDFTGVLQLMLEHLKAFLIDSSEVTALQVKMNTSKFFPACIIKLEIQLVHLVAPFFRMY